MCWWMTIQLASDFAKPEDSAAADSGHLALVKILDSVGLQIWGFPKMGGTPIGGLFISWKIQQ